MNKAWSFELKEVHWKLALWQYPIHPNLFGSFGWRKCYEGEQFEHNSLHWQNDVKGKEITIKNHFWLAVYRIFKFHLRKIPWRPFPELDVVVLHAEAAHWAIKYSVWKSSPIRTSSFETAKEIIQLPKISRLNGRFLTIIKKEEIFDIPPVVIRFFGTCNFDGRPATHMSHEPVQV